MSYMQLVTASDANPFTGLHKKRPILDEFDVTDDAYERPPVPRRTRPLSIIAIAISLLFILFLFTGFVAYTHNPGSKTLEPETCGITNSDALSHGCSFDVMSFAWLPARCFDEELMEDFLKLRPWQWYLNATTLEIADPTKVAAGQYDELYVTQEYHMYHCTYMWRKMHRAIQAGRLLDGYIGDMHHTAHCEMQILTSGRNLSDVSTTIYTKYVECPRAQEWAAGRWGWYRMINGKKVHRNPE